MKNLFSLFAMLILVGSTASAQSLPPGHIETGVKAHEDEHNRIQPFFVGANAGIGISCQILVLEMDENDITISRKKDMSYVTSFTVTQESHFVGALQGWDTAPDVELVFTPKDTPGQTYVYDMNTGAQVFTYNMSVVELPGDHKSDAASGTAYALEYPDSTLIFSDGASLRSHQMPGPKYYPCSCVCNPEGTDPPTIINEPVAENDSPIHVFPNPIRVGEPSHIRIGDYGFVNLSVTDNTGRLVQHNIMNNTVTLDVPGIYTVQIMNTNKRFQIVVQ